MPPLPSHQPEGYDCPFCRVVAGLDCEENWTKQTDVVYRDDMVTAFINAAFWPANPGAVVVIPNEHHENVYAIPDDVLAAVQIAGKRIALALKAVYGCDGTSFREHNEPAGSQDVWHYHLHVFPRYHGDDLYLRGRERRYTAPDERVPYAQKLRRHLLPSGQSHVRRRSYLDGDRAAWRTELSIHEPYQR